MSQSFNHKTKIFDKNSSLHRDVKILSWKECDENPANHESFEVYYQYTFHLLHYDGDRDVRIVLNNKYKVIESLNIILDNTDKCFVINNKVYGSQDQIEMLKNKYQYGLSIHDPLIEAENRKKWFKDWNWKDFS